MLHVFGFQFSSSFNSVAAQIHIVQTVMKEYIKFPILLSNKDFNKVRKFVLTFFKIFQNCIYSCIQDCTGIPGQIHSIA